jgi:hypothetical protein
MKSTSWRIGLAAACAAVTLFGGATSVLAAEPDGGGPADRLERLERRVNDMAQRQEQQMREMVQRQEQQMREIAQRQEQLVQRLDAQRQGPAPMAGPGRPDSRPPGGMPDGAGMGQPMPPTGALAFAGVPPPAGPSAGLAQLHRDIARIVKACALVAFVFNILVAVWIYTDIRKRGEGSGIFIALALLAGVPAAIIYLLVRIVDKKA